MRAILYYTILFCVICHKLYFTILDQADQGVCSARGGERKKDQGEHTCWCSTTALRYTGVTIDVLYVTILDRAGVRV